MFPIPDRFKRNFDPAGEFRLAESKPPSHSTSEPCRIRHCFGLILSLMPKNIRFGRRIKVFLIEATHLSRSRTLDVNCHANPLPDDRPHNQYPAFNPTGTSSIT